MLVLVLPPVSSRVSGFMVASPCLLGEAAKHVLLACFKMWKLAEVSHEMLVLMLPGVSSGISGFPVASPCLWGKLQNLFFAKVATQVVMLFCVAGVALCDIPTCLIPCRKCQNWRTSHEMLVLLRPRVSSGVSGFPGGLAVSMGEAAKPLLFEGFQACCHVVLRGRRGTLRHSNLFNHVPKESLVF